MRVTGRLGMAAFGLLIGAVGVTLTAAGAGQAGIPAAKPAATAPAAAASGPAARGKYLVMSMGCNDCHTPLKMGDNGPEPDMTRLLSGHPAEMTLPPPPSPSGPWVASASATFTAWSGPWGISYTANLTPDKETGLGSWTAQQFVDTIRNGRVQGHGRQLLPPMPWPAYKNLNDADLKAMFAFLQTITPIKNKVPDPVIAAPPAAK
jgi:mono/diheme cytochrome c family protein